MLERVSILVAKKGRFLKLTLKDPSQSEYQKPKIDLIFLGTKGKKYVVP